MKAVMLAAGKSTRTYPLTLERPKPLLKVANKTLIEHNLEQLENIVEEVIIVVGYKADMIKKYLGSRFQKVKLTYVEQKEQLGTGHALQQAEKYLKGERFIVMMSDDLYFRADMNRCLKYSMAVMSKRVENYQDYGVFIKKDEKILDIVEKPKEFISDLANTAFYIFTDKIFDCLKKIKRSPRGEYELTDALKELARTEDIFCVEAKVWLPIGYPWNLLDVDQIIRDSEVKLGKNTIVKGEIKNSSIGDNCVIEGLVKDSLIGDNVVISKDSIVESSVIANNVKFSGKILSKPDVTVKIKDRMVKVESFGAAIGDGCKLENVNIEAGTLVWPKVQKKKCTLKGTVE